MKDSFNRTIDYLRVSVTDRCNLRCFYCFPRGSEAESSTGRELGPDEIVSVVSHAIELGVRRVRLTGGEPLVRPDIVRLVKELATLQGLEELALTTNGILLEELAGPLATAGLGRVNVHLDTLDPAAYAEVTDGGDVRRVLAGLTAARAARLTPIKLNCVITSGTDAPDARAVAAFARVHGYSVRFIPRMHLESGVFSVVHGGTGGDCEHCNRLRLTSDGWVRPCLFSDLAFDIRELGVRAALERAVASKPKAGTVCRTLRFHAIGG